METPEVRETVNVTKCFEDCAFKGKSANKIEIISTESTWENIVVYYRNYTYIIYVVFFALKPLLKKHDPA